MLSSSQGRNGLLTKKQVRWWQRLTTLSRVKHVTPTSTFEGCLESVSSTESPSSCSSVITVRLVSTLAMAATTPESLWMERVAEGCAASSRSRQRHCGHRSFRCLRPRLRRRQKVDCRLLAHDRTSGRSRPGAHQALTQFATHLATETGEPALRRFDRLRRNRNRSEYGTKTFGKAEVEEAINTASAIRAACASHPYD